MLTSYSSQKDAHDGKNTGPNRDVQCRKSVCEGAISVPCCPRSCSHYNLIERRPMNDLDGGSSCFMEYSLSPTPSPNISNTEGHKLTFYFHENVVYAHVSIRYTSKHLAYDSPGIVNPAE